MQTANPPQSSTPSAAGGAGQRARPRPKSAGRSALKWLRFNGIVIAVYVLAFVLWQAATKVFTIPAFILPSPLEIIEQGARHAATLGSNLWATLVEVLVGFAIAAALSIPLGVVLIYSKTIERVVYPFLVAFQATPKVALAPILVVWFGFGLTSKVLLALVTAAFPIVINTVIGMKQTPREMTHLLRSLKATPLQVFVKARLPIAAPYIFGGLKIGITLAVVGAVVGEFIASNAGLGYLLLVSNNNLDTPMLFAVVLVLAIISSLLFYAIEAAEALLLPRPLRKSDSTLDPGVAT